MKNIKKWRINIPPLGSFVGTVGELNAQGVFSGKFISVSNATDYNRHKFNNLDGESQKDYLKRVNRKKRFYNLEISGSQTWIRVSKAEYESLPIPVLKEEAFYSEC